MAYWGEALVLGPNINAAMDPEHEADAYRLAQKALAQKAKVSGREQAYIEALARRYSGRAEDRGKRDRAYADAMRKLRESGMADPIRRFALEARKPRLLGPFAERGERDGFREVDLALPSGDQRGIASDPAPPV